LKQPAYGGQANGGLLAGAGRVPRNNEIWTSLSRDLFTPTADVIHHSVRRGRLDTEDGRGRWWSCPHLRVVHYSGRSTLDYANRAGTTWPVPTVWQASDITANDQKF